MNKCCRNFFWGRDGTPPVAWKEVYLPKDLGGAGVRMANHFNLAALAKLGWKCISDQSNWWVKSILDARQVLCKGLRWVVGNGGSIPFWTSHWVLPFPLLDLIPEHQRVSLNLDERVSDFIINNNWDKRKLSQVIDDDLTEKILSIPLPRTNLQDKLIWGPNPNGSFTIKSAYNLQFQDQPSHPRAGLLKKVWKLNIPPKVKIFA
ncbi:unnamed protein product [Prunus brigantina]